MNLNGIFLNRLCETFNWELYDLMYSKNVHISTEGVNYMFTYHTALFTIKQRLHGKEN